MNFTTWTVDLGYDGHVQLHRELHKEWIQFDNFTRDDTPRDRSYIAGTVEEQLKWIRSVGDKHLVCEKFEFRKDDVQQREKIDFTAAEYVGVVKYQSHNWDHLQMQGSAQAVGKAAFWTNDKLRKLNLFKAGKEQRHEMDALRHLLYYMAFTLNQKWLKELLK
jgi:hypothetical protein